MGSAAADVVTPDVLAGLRWECSWKQPGAGVDVAGLARDDQPWMPELEPGAPAAALGELGPGTVRHGAAPIIDNDRINRSTAQASLIDGDD